MQTLKVEHQDCIAIVSVNRPAQLNALNHQVMDDLLENFRSLQGHAGTRGIVVTGTDKHSFASGADISELQELKKRSGQRFSQRGQAVFGTIESMGKPVIAAVEGYALGGGCEMAMACHLRVASEKAVFGFPEVGLGLIPGFGGTQRLARLAGKGRALEIILDARPITAHRAYEIGLVNKVVPAGETLDKSIIWMKNILDNDSDALRKAIQAIHAAYPNRAHGFQEEAELFGSLCGNESMQQRTAAFLQRKQAGQDGEHKKEY